MSTRVHYISLAMLVLVAGMSTGCGLDKVVGPDIDRGFNGRIFNVREYTGEIRCVNPPEQWSEGDDPNKNYSLWRPLRAETGMTDYWLPQRQNNEPGFDFEVRGQSGTIVARFTIRPNGVQNDSPYNGQFDGLDWWYEYGTGRQSR